MDEKKLRDFAKKIAKDNQIPLSSIITYDKTGESNYDLQGWILAAYFEKYQNIRQSDSVVLRREDWDYYYLLGQDGSLVLTKVYTTQNLSNHMQKVTELVETRPVNFDPPDKWSDGTTRLRDLVSNRSALLLDYEVQSWRVTSHRADNTIVYIDRNFPYFLSGEVKKDGAVFLKYPQGDGLLERLLSMVPTRRFDVTNEPNLVHVRNQVAHDGSIYNGTTKNGKRHGYGEVIFPNEEIYQGTFSQGAYEGQGTYIYPAPHCVTYVGGYHNNKKHGVGVFIYKDGSKKKVFYDSGDLFISSGKVASD